MQKPNNSYLNRGYSIKVGDSFLQYPPATLWDAYEAFEEIGDGAEKILKFLKDFVDKYGTHEYEEKGKKKYYKVDFTKLDTIKLWETLQDTYFKGFFGKTGSGKPTPKGFIIYILGRVGDPYDIMKKWTLPQLEHYLDGLEYYENMKTEEGQERNKKWQNDQIDPNEIKKDLEELEDIAQQYIDGKLTIKEDA